MHISTHRQFYTHTHTQTVLHTHAHTDSPTHTLTHRQSYTHTHMHTHMHCSRNFKQLTRLFFFFSEQTSMCCPAKQSWIQQSEWTRRSDWRPNLIMLCFSAMFATWLKSPRSHCLLAIWPRLKLGEVPWKCRASSWSLLALTTMRYD